MVAPERRPGSLRWAVHAPRGPLEEALAGGAGLGLYPDRDQALFDLLLEYDALATRHLCDPEFALFPSRERAARRLAELWRAGFLARAKVAARPGLPGETDPLETGWEFAWALTALGFEALIAWDSPAARALQGDWVPLPQRPAARELGARAVAVADLALGLCAYLSEALEGSAVWVSGIQVGRRLDQANARGPRPAAAIWVLGRKGPALVALEYATTGRPDSLRRHFDRYAEGLNRPDWWRAFPPHRQRYALWSFPRQGRRPCDPEPFALAQTLLRERPELDQQMLLVCEDDWRVGRWLAITAPDFATPQELSAALRGTAARPNRRRYATTRQRPALRAGRPDRPGGNDPC